MVRISDSLLLFYFTNCMLPLNITQKILLHIFNMASLYTCKGKTYTDPTGFSLHIELINM